MPRVGESGRPVWVSRYGSTIEPLMGEPTTFFMHLPEAVLAFERGMHGYSVYSLPLQTGRCRGTSGTRFGHDSSPRVASRSTRSNSTTTRESSGSTRWASSASSLAEARENLE